jgi:hypothetical protein
MRTLRMETHVGGLLESRLVHVPRTAGRGHRQHHDKECESPSFLLERDVLACVRLRGFVLHHCLRSGLTWEES